MGYLRLDVPGKPVNVCFGTWRRNV